MASVELRGLTKRYGPLAVVDDVSLLIEHGSLVCLLGPSGCGKTTTLRLIAGFVEPTDGEIRVGDRVVSSPQQTLPPERRNMSMIFQSYALWPHMTVAENIVYGLKLRKIDSATIKKKLDGILATTRLAPLAERYPGELSGGQQQRVALARALIVEPETLLLDEPLSNLDANLREEMRFEVRRLHDEYRYTTVYVTHDQSEAMTTADLICVMNAGKIEQAGSPEEIYDRPALGIRRPLHRHEQRGQGQGAGRRHRVARRHAAARHRRDAQGRSRDAGVDPPAPDPASGQGTRRQGQRGSGQGDAASLPRIEPRLYGRGRGRHAVSVVTPAGESVAAGHRRLAALPPENCRALAGRRLTTIKTGTSATEDDEEAARMGKKFSRRGVLKGAGATALAVYASPIRAAAPPAEAVTPELIAAAKKEGKVVWYTSIDLAGAERIAKAFEAKYPGVAVRVERSGAERVFQRIGQEYQSRIYAVDVVNSSDAAHVIVWKRDGWLAPYVPEDVAKHFPAEHKDPDGMFASFRVT